MLCLPAPDIAVEDDPTRQAELSGEEIVRSWRIRAAEAERYADTLDHLRRAGWGISPVGQMLVAHRGANTLEEILELVQRRQPVGRGAPIEISVAGEGTDIQVAGGLLAGVEPHPEIYPPRTLPALVAIKPSGEQHIVDTQDELREILGEGLHDIARWLSASPSLLEKLDAAGSLTRSESLPRRSRRRVQSPRRLIIDTGQTDMCDLDAPTASVRVTPVSGAVWSAVSSKAGVMNPAMLFFPLEGVGAQLRARGSKIATELLAAPQDETRPN